MNSRLSYVDRLNDGRQRKPNSALDEITHTLNRLESHLGRAFENRGSEDEITHRIKRLADEAASEGESPVRVSAGASAERRSSLERFTREVEASRRHDNQLASVSSLARELRTLRSDMRTMINSGMREEFAVLRGELDGLLASIPPSKDTEGLEIGLARISRSIEELSERDDRDTRLLQMELERVKAAIAELVHAEQVKASHPPFSSDFDALQARLDQVASSIEYLPDTLSIRTLDDRMRQLTQALEQLALRAHGDQRELFGVIDERLDEISRAIAASAALARKTGLDAAILERIEARIGSLTNQIDELNGSQPSGVVVEHLMDLSNRVEDIAQRLEIPEQTLERLTNYVALISERLDSVAMPAEAEQMLHGIEAHLSQLSDAFARHQADLLHHGKHLFQDLEQRLLDVASRFENTDSSASDSTLLALIDDRFADLARRIDDVRGVEDERALHVLESRLENMANKLYAVAGHNTDPRLLRKLESQVSNLSSLLSQPGRDAEGLARLTPRLEHIERSISESRASLIEATRQAAEEALQKFAASQRAEPMDARLQDELQKLEVLTRQTAERNSKTFDAIHHTLLKIVSRLGTLETEGTAPRGDMPVSAPVFSGFASGQANPADAAPAKNQHAALFGTVSEPADDAPKSRLRGFLSRRNRKHAPSDVEPSLSAPMVEESRASADDAPDINSILRRVVAEKNTHLDKRADTAKADFIAAARRAAMSSAEQHEDVQSEGEITETKGKLGFGSILARHKKHAMMALGGVIILAGGVQFASTISNRTAAPSIATIAETPSKPSAAISEVASAPSDPIQTGTIPTVSTTEKTFAEERVIPNNAFAAVEKSAEETSSETANVKFVPEASQLPAELDSEPLREAALQGNEIAFFEIANRLAEGRGLPEDLEAAATWYERAAEQGLALAQYRIGNMYEKGVGVERNIADAKKWYKLAAEQGNLNAMHNLGVLLAMGADGGVDNKAAVRWFTEAADLNVTDSQFNLAILAAKGLGMPKDMTEAYKWFDIVARKGDADAAAKRDEIAAGMEPDVLKIAKGKATLWKARTIDPAANTVTVPVEWGNAPVLSDSLEFKQAVANIQLILNKFGFDAGAADGIMGTKTRNAIKAFQAENGLTPSGEIDNELVQKLLERNETA